MKASVSVRSIHTLAMVQLVVGLAGCPRFLLSGRRLGRRRVPRRPVIRSHCAAWGHAHCPGRGVTRNMKTEQILMPGSVPCEWPSNTTRSECHNGLHFFGLREDEVSHSISSLPVWFSMATDNGLAVCANTVLSTLAYKVLRCSTLRDH